MDIIGLIPEFLVFSLTGSSLSIAAYSAFKDRNDDRKLLLIISICFSLAFMVVFILTFSDIDNLSTVPFILALDLLHTHIHGSTFPNRIRNSQAHGG